MTGLNFFTREEKTESVVKAKKKRSLPKCVREEEFVKLIKAVPTKDIKSRIAFLLGYSSGLRVSEIQRCSPEHFRNNSIFIPESKYGVERVVPIPKGWRESFTKMLPLNTSIRSIQRWFEKYREKAGLPKHYSIHSLRHGFATRCLEKGVPINQVQILIGHSNLATTSIYTKANPTDALNSFEELF